MNPERMPYEKIPCIEAWTSVRISATRDLCPCCRPVIFGRFEKGVGFYDIWHGETAVAFREETLCNKAVCAKICGWGGIRGARPGRMNHQRLAAHKKGGAGFHPKLNWGRGPSREYTSNIARLESEIRLGETRPVSIPTLWRMNLSTDCNAVCVFCRQRYHGLQPFPEECIEDIFRVIFENHMKIGRVQVGGGEPFFAKPTLRFLRRCAEVRPHFVLLLSTNGLLLPKELVKNLNLEQMTFSVHAATKELAEKMMGRSHFETVLKNLEWVRDQNIPVNINCVVTQRNAHEVPQMIRLFERDMGVRIGFHSMTDPNKARKGLAIEDAKGAKREEIVAALKLAASMGTPGSRSVADICKSICTSPEHMLSHNGAGMNRKWRKPCDD